jgi:Amt family ammonium transporter
MKGDDAKTSRLFCQSEFKINGDRFFVKLYLIRRNLLKMNDISQIVDVQNMLFMFIATGGIFFMQAGFCFLEAGSVRSKNSINVAIKNFTDFCLAVTVFWCFGFAVMFHQTGDLITVDYLFFSVTDPKLTSFFFFQLVFCGTTASIMSGAVAERTTFAGYLLVAFFVSSLIYPLFGRWVWSSATALSDVGWLGQLGYYDFAGASVVHGIGGWAALAAVMVIGPRAGRFAKGLPRIQGHNVPMATVGTIILWLGWFGFNAGSLLELSDKLPLVLLNTSMAAAIGAMVTLVISWKKDKADVYHILNGALAGLVSITGVCNAVSTAQAVVIGALGGCVYYLGSLLLDKYHIDDVVKAVPVHGFCGIWAVVAVGLFGDPAVLNTGLDIYQQVAVQSLGGFVCIVWGFVPTYFFLSFAKRYIQLRVSLEDEIKGLNVSEHNASTESVDLLSSMQMQKNLGDYNRNVPEDPHTEIGQIAKEYNLVLNQVYQEMQVSQHAHQKLLSSYSKLKEAQGQLVEAEKMAALGGLVVGMAHEINTPIGIGVTAASFLWEETESIIAKIKQQTLSKSGLKHYADSAQHSSNILLSNLRRTALLVDNFKQVAVEQSKDKCREFELGSYINDVLLSLGIQNESHDVAYESANKIPMRSDPGALGQVISNLISNTFKHGFESIEKGEVVIHSILKNEIVTIKLTDNGCGIEKDNIKSIFDPFFTTKRGLGNSGLGLSIVYNLVTLTLGGKITCESDVGEGTRFILEIPQVL